MITHVCVAIQLLGTPAAPDAMQALQQHCDSVLGAGECRLTRDGSNDDKNECWRATLVRTADEVMASVVVGGSRAAAGRFAQRNVTFQLNDEQTDRWATLGLLIAALVTQEEHAVAASAPPANAAAAPASETPSRTGSSWLSRDRSEPNTVSEQPEEEAHGLMHLADLRLLGVYDAGRLPWATVGGRLSATFGLVHHIDLEIGGTYLLSTTTILPPPGSGGTGRIHFDLRSLTLGLCPKSRLSATLSGHACVGGDFGLMTVSDPEDPISLTGYLLLPNVWLGFDSMVRLTPHLALVAEYKAEVIVSHPPSVIAPNFNTVGSSRIFQSERFSENVAIGVAGTF